MRYSYPNLVKFSNERGKGFRNHLSLSLSLSLSLDRSIDRSIRQCESILVISDAVEAKETCDEKFGVILSCVRKGVVAVKTTLLSKEEGTYRTHTLSI
jgi:hypothetical protein